MVNICLSCSKYPFCKNIEDNKKECKEYIKQEKKYKKLVKKDGVKYIFEDI